jgi:hypothetical protein
MGGFYTKSMLTGFVALLGFMIPVGGPFITTSTSTRAQENADTRQTVRLEPVERDALMTEMRTMLRSINRILHGLAAGDSAMVESASRASGMAGTLSLPLQAKLPAHFVQLDSKTHRRFDDLARVGVRSDKALLGLAMVTAYCVSCHDTYRVEETARPSFGTDARRGDR